MPVQGLGVEETALAVAAAEGGRGRPGVLGVAAASTSTVVPLGRLRRAAGAHFPEITADVGRGCPWAGRECRDGLPRAAAATGNSATRVARGSAASASRAPARICGSGKLGRESHNSSPIFEVGAQFSPPGCVARTPPGAPARAERALVGAPPYHFALDQFGRAVFAAAHLQKRRAGPFATRFKERSSRRAALGTARGSAAHPIQ